MLVNSHHQKWYSQNHFVTATRNTPKINSFLSLCVSCPSFLAFNIKIIFFLLLFFFRFVTFLSSYQNSTKNGTSKIILSQLHAIGRKSIFPLIAPLFLQEKRTLKTTKNTFFSFFFLFFKKKAKTKAKNYRTRKNFKRGKLFKRIFGGE